MQSPNIISLDEKITHSPKLSVMTNNQPGSIKLNNLPALSPTTPSKKVNFGPGADLLMNQKRTSGNSPKSDIKLSELKSLEINSHSMSRESARELMMGTTPNKSTGIKLNINEVNLPKPINSQHPSISLGNSTANSDMKNKSNDFKQFNEIPVNPTTQVPDKPPMSNEELLKKKLMFLRKLENLEKKGAILTKKYTMNSPLAEMQGEYEMIKSEKEKSNSIKFQGKMMMAAVSAIEFLNSKFDPFDIKLDGWGESISESMDDYDEVFGELHEKYGGKTKIAPEIKVLFMLGGSAAMLHMTNTMFKSAVPGMDDIMRQNPELMQQFTQAAVSSMSQNNPGFGGFMQGVMNNKNGMPPRGAPPGPSMQMRQNPPVMPGMSGRPDIGMARGIPNFNDAENMENEFSSVPPRSTRRPPSRTPRPEMKGPSDISDLLSGIKTKTVNIKNSGDDKSTVSVSELQELNNTDLKRAPKRSARRKRSERSTISLNI